MKKDLKEFYQRRLPHWQPVGGVFFVTVCLKGAVSKQVLRKLRVTYEEDLMGFEREGEPLKEAKNLAHQQYLLGLFKAISKEVTDESYLAKFEVAEILKEQFHRYDGQLYHLIAYSIMYNHFHVVFDTGAQVWEKGVDFDENEYVQVFDIMKKIKGPSAYYANQYLGRKGGFWQLESWDRWIRDEKELGRWVEYTLMNPVKARLVQNWKDWPHNYYSWGDF